MHCAPTQRIADKSSKRDRIEDYQSAGTTYKSDAELTPSYTTVLSKSYQADP